RASEDLRRHSSRALREAPARASQRHVKSTSISNPMKIRDAKDCKYDLVSLGECMLRLSPPQHGRIEFAPLLELWVGGGEYNVSYALARLGLRTGWVGGLNSSPMGAIVRNHARAVGMSTDYVVERKYYGVGKKDRIGLNFTEV